VTAHVLEVLGTLPEARQAAERGVTWLLHAQEDDGSWFGRWAPTTSTGPVRDARFGRGGLSTIIPPYVGGGVARSPSKRRRWMGEDLRSYREPAYRGRALDGQSDRVGADRAPQRSESSVSLERGLAYLVNTQRDDGTWDEPWFTGTGFPRDFYINYHLYRQVFPLMALGRYVTRGTTTAELEVITPLRIESFAFGGATPSSGRP